MLGRRLLYRNLGPPMISLCPKCLLEGRPSGKWEELLYIDGAIRCAYHGILTMPEINALFERAKSQGLLPPSRSQSVSDNPHEDKAILVTDAMIKAGLSEFEALLGVADTEFLVRRVYIAMERTRASDIYVVWWQYSDKSGMDMVRCFEIEDEAEEFCDLLHKHGDNSKTYKVSKVELGGA